MRKRKTQTAKDRVLAEMAELKSQLLTAHQANEALHRRLQAERELSRIRLEGYATQHDALLTYQRKEIHKLLGLPLAQESVVDGKQERRWIDSIPQIALAK